MVAQRSRSSMVRAGQASLFLLLLATAPAAGQEPSLAGQPLFQNGAASSMPALPAAASAPQAATSPFPSAAPLPHSPWGAAPADPWVLQVLPDGLLYRSYAASLRESRFRSLWIYESDRGWVWDAALGGRVGILRYGTEGALWPEGWQLDIEGAAFPRLDPEEEVDLEAADFRFGVPLTYAADRYQFKLAYYHLSSHLGDEFLLKNPTFPRRNYVRDAIVIGAGYFPHPDWRLYAEAGWAFFTAGGAEPWEFQVGAEYSPALATGWRGAPFFAINGDFREELDFGGGLSVASGWQWRGDHNDHIFRAGLQYYNGPSFQLEFLREHEQYIGFGLWYDY